MITVNIKGGLGNQMFQYACGRALALRHNDKLGLVRSEYQKDIDRPFSLNAFRIDGSIVASDDVPFHQRLAERLRQKLTRNFRVAFDPEIVKKTGQIYLDGYFQSEKYFSDQSEVIRQDLVLKEGLKDEAAEAAILITDDHDSISIHVRRGDYVTHPDFGGIADREYYDRAIKYMQKMLPAARFYIFSDDIGWCRVNLPIEEDSATFISRPEFKDYEELWLMSLAKHHIIANSSFSWWGAWLGDNREKIVVAPSRWGNQHEDWYKDIIPKAWIRL